MPKHIVTCRICKEKFDTSETSEWVMPSQNWYYHTQCYATFGKNKTNIHADVDNDMWFAFTWDYLRKDLHIDLNYEVIKRQWDSYIIKGKTAKGIYFCLRYFYDVQHGDVSKSNGGIGIVPYIYETGCQYWIQKEKEDAGICQRIENQIKERQEQIPIIIRQKKKPKKKTIDLLTSIALEDENE